MKDKILVAGMSCSACASTIETTLNNQQAIKSAKVDLMNNCVYVEYDPQNIDLATIEQLINNLGYKVQKEQVVSSNNKLKSLIISISLSFILMDIAMGHMLKLPISSWVFEHPLLYLLLQWLLSSIIILINKEFIIKGVKSLINKAFTMDSLVSLGTLSSYGYGLVVIILYLINGDKQNLHNLYFDGAAMILTFVSLGKYFEDKSKNKSKEAIDKLLALKPSTVLIKKDNKQYEVAYDQVTEGSILVIRKGDKVACDGKLLSSQALLDESLLSGEAIPVLKQKGDEVIAGTINNGDIIEVEACKVGDDTSLNKMADLVMQSINSKPQIARLADKISHYFVPTIITLAILTFIVWFIITQQFSVAFNFGISVLVISCPCALGLATPVSIVTAMGTTAKNGILIKNGEVLEQSKQVDVVFLDKTGTISQGQPQVVNCDIEGDDLANISLLESKSNHPLAKAITEYCPNSLADVDHFKEYLGQGISGVVDKDEYVVGNKKLFDQLAINIPSHIDEKPGVLVAKNSEYLGFIEIVDPLKPQIAKVIQLLHNQHIKVVLLSGDNAQVVNDVAHKIKVDKAIGSVLPHEKQQHIKAAQKQGYHVMMVGDGVNDALALSCADVSVAMNSGSDIAIESSDVVLRSGDIMDLVNYLNFAKKTLRNIKENLFWALIYNVIAIPLAAGVFYPLFGWKLEPMIAALAMSCSSLFVVSNALRLRKMSKIKEEVKMKKCEIKINGMMCQHCQKRVEDELNKFNLTEVIVDLENKCAKFMMPSDQDLNDITEAIKSIGYEVVDSKEI